MNKFKRSLFGYNTKEVNKFIDDIINNVERIINSNKEKTEKINRLEKEIENLKKYPNKNDIVKSEEELSKTLSDSILLTKNTTDTIKKVEDERINIIKEKLTKTIEEQKRLLEELDKK